MLANFIIENAYYSLTNNFRAALRISLIPFGIALVLALVLNAGSIMLMFDPQGYQRFTGIDVIMLFVGLLFILVAGYYTAVRWHLFSLGVSGHAGFSRVFAYFFVALVVSLISVLPAMLVGFVGGVFFFVIGAPVQTTLLSWAVIEAAGTGASAYVFFRFATWLVSVALNEPLAGNWGRTRPLAKVLMHTAVIYAAASFLWSLFGLAGLPLPLAIVADLFLSWFAFMISIAVLTEIYRASEPVHAT